MKSIVIESLVASQKTAVLEDGKLVDIFIEDNKKDKTISNIYRGIVKKVLPGIEACFVDIGYEKLAYLQLKKDDNIKAGQEVLVQINKEEIGTKGAKLNLEVSLAGRYLVYIPSNTRVTMSNKILEEKERFRLKKIVNTINTEKMGLIIRTEAQGCSKEELEKDIEDLKNRFEEISKEYKLGIGPKLLYKSLDFATKYVKDNINNDIEKVIINDKEKYEDLKLILKSIKKDYIQKLTLEENKDLFDLYKVNSQIEKVLNKKVWLKSGGYLIIEKTEALTVIDVNTGKFTGSLKLDETVYKTNLEAAKEIARQLRIRDLAGIIIVDFIDMSKNKHKQTLIKTLELELSKDKRKSEVLGITKLGLVEIARRREKDSIYKYYLKECLECEGKGYIKSANYLIDNIEKEIIRIKEHTSYNNIKIELHNELYDVIQKNFTETIKRISKKYDVIIELEAVNNINYEKINIIYNS
ncbi:Rne/Rng family ribonuclease [Romboutsia sp.]|uniref:Rne/Rng family ribonuclease n=1 Tax=Romboutsia sp. TaxID=1965302 RepID=UPI003F3251B4